MKLKFQYLMLIGFILPFVLLSCKTTGPTVDYNDPVDEAFYAAIVKARAQAEEDRSRAESVNGSAHCPDEWGAAEDRYAAAKGNDTPVTKMDAFNQEAEWQNLSIDYKEIYHKSIPLIAEEQLKLLDAAREAAVNAGAEEVVPDRLAQADTLAEQSGQKFDDTDFFGSMEDGKEALVRYKILQTIAEARSKQVEADNNGFFSQDPDNYMLAAEAGNNAVDFYDEGKLPEAQAAADEALSRFKQVISNGWGSRVEEKAAAANKWRDAALAVKANVAVKSEYDAADQVYNNANAALRAEEYAVAAELFGQSEGLFNKAHDNAVVKRDRAEEALREAEQKLAASEEKAQTAAEFLGGE